MRKSLFWVLTAFLLIALTACGKSEKKEKTSHIGALSIISGSENETLEPLLEQFTQQTGIKVEMQYQGSVDIMLQLGSPSFAYDAVWPANSLWITLGDKNLRVKNLKPIMNSPVIFGIRKSLAEKLGFVGKRVTVRDILSKTQAGELNFMMTSATQSNSGASAYLGFLYALSGNPESLQMEDLDNPETLDRLQSLLSAINRSSGSSGWLKDLFLSGNYDAMVNYEALIIETNLELIKMGREPLQAVYPHDGIVFADSPLGFVDQGHPEKKAWFEKLQTYLLSEPVQRQLVQLGRRTAMGNLLGDYPREVFRPEWGIDPGQVLTPIHLPAAPVIASALERYQTTLRKPSFTVYCLDYSGSMSGEGEDSLKTAMKILLDQRKAKEYMLQQSDRDVIVVIPFSSEIKDIWRVDGDDPASLSGLLQSIQSLSSRGGTDIYTPTIKGLSILKEDNIKNYIPAVILMTDGESNEGRRFSHLREAWFQSKIDVPVFSILFGNASQDQLKDIAELTHGRIFDGRSDLVRAFRQAKGYN